MHDEFHTPFPNYDVLDKRDTPSWDETTRRVVAKRLDQVPTRRFLEPDEWETLQAVCDRLIPQPDRPHAPVPIVPWIDEKLDKNQGDGYRYADMPPLRETWRLGIRGIDEESQIRYKRAFIQLSVEEQDAVLTQIQQGEVQADVWRQLPPQRFFADTLLQTTVGIYYEHPAAWSEIGYGGPASPRGYVRLGFNQRDAWEAEEKDG